MISQRSADIARYRLGIGQPIIACQQYDPGAVHSSQAREKRAARSDISCAVAWAS